jgi:hypothetical protein
VAAFVAAFVVASMVGALAACADILGIEANRYVDSGTGDEMNVMPDTGDNKDTGAPPGAEAGPWDCLNKPTQSFTPGAMTTVKFIAVDALQMILQQEKVDGGSGLELVSYTPLPGIPVRACSSILTPGCDFGTGTSYVTTDDAGIAVFTLPQSFDGFYELNSPNLFTTSFFPSQMVAGEAMTEIPGTLLTITAEAELETVLPGVKLSHDLDGGLGHVLLSVFDCNDHFADKVYFVPSMVSPNAGFPTLIFYTVGQGSTELPSTSATQTDQAGAGGILNVPVGLFHLTAYLNTPTGAVMIGVLDVNVKAGLASSGILRVRTH